MGSCMGRGKLAAVVANPVAHDAVTHKSRENCDCVLIPIVEAVEEAADGAPITLDQCRATTNARRERGQESSFGLDDWLYHVETNMTPEANFDTPIIDQVCFDNYYGENCWTMATNFKNPKRSKGWYLNQVVEMQARMYYATKTGQDYADVPLTAVPKPSVIARAHIVSVGTKEFIDCLTKKAKDGKYQLSEGEFQTFMTQTVNGKSTTRIADMIDKQCVRAEATDNGAILIHLADVAI
jgi:hypothetical protein